MLQNRTKKRINFSEAEARLSSHDGEIRESAISEFASGGYPAARYLVNRLRERVVLFKKFSTPFKDALEKEAREAMLEALVRIGTPSLKAMKVFELPIVRQTIIKGLSTEQLITALEEQEYPDNFLERFVEELVSRENSEVALSQLFLGYSQEKRIINKTQKYNAVFYLITVIATNLIPDSNPFHDIFLFFSIICIFTSFRCRFDPRLKTRNALLNVISKKNNPEMTGAFLLCLKYQEMRRMVEMYLRRILPQLRPEHRKCLSQQAMKELLGTLKSDDKRLAHASLQAILQVGDAEAIPAVERLVKQGWSEDLRQAAADCLIVLKQRQEAQQNSQTLLRASDSEKSLSAPAELLRPSFGSRNIEPEQLLRASETE